MKVYSGTRIAMSHISEEFVKLEDVKLLKSKLEEIVVHEGEDAGVILLSNEAPSHYDKELKANVYELEYFTPLGSALVELHKMLP
jgi:hypothetical protein